MGLTGGPESGEELERRWAGLRGRGSQTWAHLLLSAHEFTLQPLVSPQLGPQPTQIPGHTTGEAVAFSRGKEMAKGISTGGWGADPLLERSPFLLLGSHLDLGEGFQQISVNFEGDLSVSAQAAVGLGQRPQLQPGSPAHRRAGDGQQISYSPSTSFRPLC